MKSKPQKVQIPDGINLLEVLSNCLVFSKAYKQEVEWVEEGGTDLRYLREDIKATIRDLSKLIRALKNK